MIRLTPCTSATREISPGHHVPTFRGPRLAPHRTPPESGTQPPLHLFESPHTSGHHRKTASNVCLIAHPWTGPLAGCILPI